MAVVLGRRWVRRQRGAVGARVRQLAFMSGRHSTLLTHMIFWAFRPLSLSIIHGRFNRVIPLATYPRDWPLARPLTALIRGLTLDLQALLLRSGEMESLQPDVHTRTFLLPCLPSQIAQNSLEENLGVFYVNSLSTQSAGNVHQAQLCSGRGGEYSMVSVPSLRRERPGPQRLPNEGRQQLE